MDTKKNFPAKFPENLRASKSRLTRCVIAGLDPANHGPGGKGIVASRYSPSNRFRQSQPQNRSQSLLV